MGKVAYRGWNCWKLSNCAVELVVTLDVGPRIIRFGFVGEENEFKEYEQTLGRRGGSEWRIYGGHRLWHAPEARPRSYLPDNSPVRLRKLGRAVRLVQEPEAESGIQKEMDILLASAAPRATVTHRLRNTGLWPVELAPWALSVVAQGGRAIVPLPTGGAHEKFLLPTKTLTLWAYTDMTDPRWTWGRNYVMLRQDPAASGPQKVGLPVPAGWCAYANRGHLFLKRAPYIPGARYPDAGCSVETYTCPEMLELETVGPLVTLAPGETVEHVEDWYLFRNVPLPENDADVEKNVLPCVKAAAKI